MKKITLFLFASVLSLSPFLVHAQSADLSKIYGNFSATGDKTVDLSLSNYSEIDGDEFQFLVMVNYLKNQPVILVLELFRGTQQIFSQAIHSSQVGEPVGTVKMASIDGTKKFEAGEYILRAKDTMNSSVVYADKKFTVIADDSREIITKDDYGVSATIGISNNIHVSITGTMKPQRTIRGTSLVVQYKKTSESIYKTNKVLFPENNDIRKGEMFQFSDQIKDLEPNTAYNIRIVDTKQNPPLEIISVSRTTTGSTSTPPAPEVITAIDYGLVTQVDSNDGIKLVFSGTLTPTKDISQSELRVRYRQAGSTYPSSPLSALPELSKDGEFVGGRMNHDLKKGSVYTFTYTIPSLIAGTSYDVQIYDKNRNDLEVKSFRHTTAGTTPSQGGTNVNDGIIASDYGLPTLSVTPGEKVALLKDEVTPQKTITNAQLYVFFGTSRDNLTQGKPLFGQASVTLQSGESKSFDYTFDNLQSGTDYFYKIRDIGRNLDVTTGILAFKTLGNLFEDPENKDPTNPTNPTVGGDPYVFDPNAQDGIFGNYSYPTNLGQPDSDGSASRLSLDTPLVPCGKSSDEGTEDETCRFSHVIVLINNLITFGLIMMVPLIALICIYAGVMMIIKRQAPEELTQIKKRFSRIGVGILVMLLAWTLVATVFNSLVSYNSKAIILLDLDDLG